jgi:SPP1 family predicted phage head-tail adaptor
MQIGPMRQRVTIQNKTQQVVDHEPTFTWSNFATVWAEKRDPKGQEITEQLSQQTKLKVTFRIRYLNGVTTQSRVVWDSRAFDIQAVTNPDQRKRWMMLHCMEHDGSGD